MATPVKQFRLSDFDRSILTAMSDHFRCTDTDIVRLLLHFAYTADDSVRRELRDIRRAEVASADNFTPEQLCNWRLKCRQEAEREQIREQAQWQTIENEPTPEGDKEPDMRDAAERLHLVS